MTKNNQGSVASLLLMAFFVGGLVISVFLIGKQTILSNHAQTVSTSKAPSISCPGGYSDGVHCWYTGSYGQSCNSVCQGHSATCESSNWNDSQNCTFGKNLNSCATCQISFDNSAPWYNQTVGVCYYRSSAGPSQLCSASSFSQRRLCECKVQVPTGITTTADFSMAPSTGTSPLTVKFTNKSWNAFTYPPILTYLWTFGDGATSTQENPSHAYYSDTTVSNGGTTKTYTVTLKATDPRGNDSDTTTQTVSVTIPFCKGANHFGCGANNTCICLPGAGKSACSNDKMCSKPTSRTK